MRTNSSLEDREGTGGEFVFLKYSDLVLPGLASASWAYQTAAQRTDGGQGVGRLNEMV